MYKINSLLVALLYNYIIIKLIYFGLLEAFLVGPLTNTL